MLQNPKLFHAIAGCAVCAPLLALAGIASAQDAPGAGTASGPAAAETAPDRFTIAAFDISGVSRLSPDEVERIVYPFTGPEKTSQDVEAARKAVQDAYAAKGYEAVVVDIPTQSTEAFREGLVQIAVQEAPLGKVIVSGARHHSADTVRAQVPSLVEGQAIDLRALQSDVAAANRFPDRTINPSFKAGSTPGTVDVELKVKDELPLHASVELNNDNSPSTTPLRTTASVRYSNLWGAGHTISATYIVAPERRNDSEVFSGSYTAPLIGTPWSVLLYGYRSNSNIAALGGSNVLGNGYQIGLRAIYKLPADKTYQTISFGPDYKDFQQDIFIAGVAAGSAPIRYVPLVAEYSLAGATEKSNFDFNLGVTAGLRTFKVVRCVIAVDGTPCPSGTTRDDPCYRLPGTDPARCTLVDQFRNREIDSNENFVHVNLTANYSHAFGDFIAAYRLNAQYADSHLITNEQYSLGGLTSIRGYFQSEAVGDEGFSQSIELRSPSLATVFGSFVDELRIYGFVDGGYAHVRSALPDQKSNFGLIGIGAGARIRLFDAISGEGSLALPLRDGPVTSTGDPRIIFVLRGEF